MRFALTPKRSVLDNLSRIASGQLSQAIDVARDKKRPTVDRIHAARARAKRVRGMLRIVGNALPAYKTEDIAMHAAATSLSRTRDHDVLPQTLEAILKRHRNWPADEVDRLRAAVADPSPDEERVLSAFAEMAEPIVVHVALWAGPPPHWDDVVKGTAKTYASARKKMHRAFETGVPADLHAWRRQVKYHLFHMLLLRRITDGLAARREDVADLEAVLGRHHDLEVLLDHVTERLSPEDSAVLRLGRDARKRQDKYVRRSETLGRRLFGARCKRFAEELRDRMTLKA